MSESAPSIRNRWNQLLQPWRDGTQDCPSFEGLAGCLAAAGMAAEAARCRTWALLEPEEGDWRGDLEQWDARLNCSTDARLLLEPHGGSGLPPQRERSEKFQSDDSLIEIQALLDQGLLHKACEQMRAMAYWHGLPPGLCNRTGMLFEQAGDFAEAECWYRTSLLSESSQVQTWFSLASVLLKQHAADEALEAAERGLALHPRHPWGLKLQQRSLTQMRAVDTLRNLAREHPLPFPLDVDALEADSRLVRSPVSDLTLADRIAWRHALPKRDGPVWAIGLSSLTPIQWLLGQEILTAPIELMAFGCADRDHFMESSTDTPLQCSFFGPHYWLALNESNPTLVVIDLLDSMHCSRFLTEVICRRRVALFASHNAIIHLSNRRLVGGIESWSLWSAESICELGDD